MSDGVDWVKNRGPTRRLRRMLLVGLAVFVVGNASVLLWNPSAGFSDLLSFLLMATILGSVWIAAFSATPTQVAVDGGALRVRYFGGERRLPLGEVVAVDLAPGTPRGGSNLRLATRRGRTIAVPLETPVAESIASRLERTGTYVNRRPPPQMKSTP